MISKGIKDLCCEDISLIENYEEAINSDELWDCHHRKETDLGLTQNELVAMGMYYNRPASELIFLTKSAHRTLHGPWNKGLTKETDERVAAYGRKNKGKIRSEEHCRHISESKTGKKIPALQVPKSETAKQHMRENHADYNGGKNPAAKPVECITNGKRYLCIKEAVEDLGIGRKLIIHSCKTNEAVKGFIFKFG